uniref:Putative mediator of rna polymerase ii transcription subunit 26 n=1 Tax=Nyssomyia neivai TaxID=330878 RepID=A0A1L8DHQ6_9DIPT
MNGKKFGGRTSSQISIYDYPEHLNPFYEDENHKRLRFWKIGKKSDKVKRSNSFSLDGIRELWNLKSFRLKKKSSTLGINKTSESPPPLRRTLMVDQHETDRQYHTLDPSSRHTVSVGLNSNFERSSRYRSSLQDMSTMSPFNRGDRYRNTMQNGQEYSNRGGSSLLSGSYSGHMVHSSSQQSISSTNPFEDGENQATTSGSSTGGVKKPVRKKRRAPPPPTPKPTQEISTREPEKVEESIEPEQAVAISNLTAEIESFVKQSDADESKECTEISIPVPAPRREKKESSKFQVTKSEAEIVLRITESLDDLTSDNKLNAEEVEKLPNKEIPDEEKKLLNKEIPDEEKKSPDKEIPEVVFTVKDSKESELQITEDVVMENAPKAPAENGQMLNKSDPYKNVVVEMEKYEIRFAPLKANDEGEHHRRNPIERQRSVQEIIESINKNQSLLRINYEDDSRVQSIMKDIETQKFETERRKSSDSLRRNIAELEVKEREMRELIKELEEQETYEIPLPVREFNNNSSRYVQLREKDVVDQNENQTKVSSIEWNPLPKPRRSRNLSEEVDVTLT